MRIAAVIPAGGAGKRISKYGSTNLPKQFWPLGEKRILEHVVCALEASPLIKEIIIACPRQFISYCRKHIVKKNDCKKVSHIVAGGIERSLSVSNCLRKISRNVTHVLIQDAVRPFITNTMVKDLAEKIRKKDGIIIARPVVPTIKKVIGKTIVETVSRDMLWEAETPQLFKKAVLFRAFKKAKKNINTFTDEASLIETYGGVVDVAQSDTVNLKITTYEDYCMVQKIMETPQIKIGLGYDVHRLVKGRKLMIGGVKIPFTKGTLGHSDGDCLLHAITDAMLGAAALGDIGDHFPDTKKSLKNIDSAVILDNVNKRINKKGLFVQNIDAFVILERPKLGKYKKIIQHRIAKILSLCPEHVNIKAKTNEGLGSEGSGFSLSAQAVVALKRSN